MNPVLFLSHALHDAHKGFAQAVDARIAALPFEPYIRLIKRFPSLRYAYPFLTALYGSLIRSREDVLIADGASSLFAALAVKKRRSGSKLIYLDADLFFYNLCKNDTSKNEPFLYFLKEIDAVITVSEANKKYCARFLDVPIRVCPPFPKKLRRTDGIRKSYGLYVGRLDPDKNIKRIVAFGLQCPFFEKFIIVGNGVLRNWVEKTARKSKKLLYAGVQEDVERYYNECQFLVHIPDHDPHPTTPMEAALCGCFPLMTKTIGTASLFDDLFLIEDPDDFVAINGRIKYIMERDHKVEELLRQDIEKMPTKASALKTFRETFTDVVNQVREK